MKRRLFIVLAIAIPILAIAGIWIWPLYVLLLGIVTLGTAIFYLSFLLIPAIVKWVDEGVWDWRLRF